MKSLTRRSLALSIAAAPLLAQVAQTPQGTPPLSAPPGATPNQKASNAAADVREVSDRLAQTEVPMSIEPACSFRA